MKKMTMKEMLEKVFANTNAERIVVFGYDVYMKISNEAILVANFESRHEIRDNHRSYQLLDIKVINKITGSKIDENKLVLTGEDCGFELLEDCNGYVHWGHNAPCIFETPRNETWVYEYILNHINKYIELFK